MKTHDKKDRSVGAAQSEFEMSNFENGLLSSLLMFGRIVGCLLTIGISFKWPPMHLIGGGMLMWTIGAVTCGLSVHFYMIATCRFAMGVGQSAVIGLGNVVIGKPDII